MSQGGGLDFNVAKDTGITTVRVQLRVNRAGYWKIRARLVWRPRTAEGACWEMAHGDLDETYYAARGSIKTSPAAKAIAAERAAALAEATAASAAASAAAMPPIKEDDEMEADGASASAPSRSRAKAAKGKTVKGKTKRRSAKIKSITARFTTFLKPLAYDDRIPFVSQAAIGPPSAADPPAERRRRSKAAKKSKAKAAKAAAKARAAKRSSGGGGSSSSSSSSSRGRSSASSATPSSTRPMEAKLEARATAVGGGLLNGISTADAAVLLGAGGAGAAFAGNFDPEELAGYFGAPANMQQAMGVQQQQQLQQQLAYRMRVQQNALSAQAHAMGGANGMAVRTSVHLLCHSPQSSVPPLSLFQSSTHFFLALTQRTHTTHSHNALIHSTDTHYTNYTQGMATMSNGMLGMSGMMGMNQGFFATAGGAVGGNTPKGGFDISPSASQASSLGSSIGQSGGGGIGGSSVGGVGPGAHGLPPAGGVNLANLARMRLSGGLSGDLGIQMGSFGDLGVANGYAAFANTAGFYAPPGVGGLGPYGRTHSGSGSGGGAPLFPLRQNSANSTGSLRGNTSMDNLVGASGIASGILGAYPNVYGAQVGTAFSGYGRQGSSGSASAPALKKSRKRSISGGTVSTGWLNALVSGGGSIGEKVCVCAPSLLRFFKSSFVPPAARAEMSEVSEVSARLTSARTHPPPPPPPPPLCVYIYMYVS